ncbi:MAG: AI-2E family transporter [Rikenellaceae bacterium]|jgi:predicted PurR-regulated permease PerM|nr:AI-2E family transporter [Rikenellaceae bacterium]
MRDTIRKNDAFFRQLLFLGILLAIGIMLVGQLSFFIGSFLGAITLYIVFRGLLFRLVEKRGWRPWQASLLIIVAISIILLGVGFLVLEVLASELPKVNTNMLLEGVNALVKKINDLVEFQLISSKLIAQSSSLLTGMATTIVNTTYSFAANIFMMIVILYFMLANARTLEEKVSKYLPFRGHNRDELIGEVTSIIYSNAVGIPLIMLAQGVVAGLIYLAFGMHNVVFWAFLTSLCGLIPMIGTVIVSVPLGVYFIAQGLILKGILLMLCGVLVIANVDNLFRIILNQRISKTHPLIVIFGVIMGIPLLGFWGIIFGPLLISVFLLLIRIYYKEYKLIEPEEPLPVPPPLAEDDKKQKD